MRRLVFSICALSLIAASCVCESLILKKITLQLTETIRGYAVTIKNESEIEPFGKAIESDWEKKRKIISMFANEDVFLQADKQIGELKYARSTDDFKLRCASASENVAKTLDSELPKAENIL